MTTTPRRSISAGISNENFLKARIMAVTRYPMATVPIPLTPARGIIADGGPFWKALDGFGWPKGAIHTLSPCF